MSMTAFLLHPRRHSLFLLALLALFLTPPGVRAQFGLENKPVTAELVSELSTVGTGKPFKVAVKLEHQPLGMSMGRPFPQGLLACPPESPGSFPKAGRPKNCPGQPPIGFSPPAAS